MQNNHRRVAIWIFQAVVDEKISHRIVEAAKLCIEEGLRINR